MLLQQLYCILMINHSLIIYEFTSNQSRERRDKRWLCLAADSICRRCIIIIFGQEIIQLTMADGDLSTIRFFMSTELSKSKGMGGYSIGGRGIGGRCVGEETLPFVIFLSRSPFDALQQKSMKNKKKTLPLLVLLSLLVMEVFTASPEVTINYVSSTLNSFTSASGSKGGGTVLYISGVNFSPIAGDIQIFIGNYPCILVAEGSTVSMVSCTTTAMTDPNAQYSLPITMYTANLLPVTCKTYICLFSYSDYQTPFILNIYPSTAVGNQLMTINGYHRITNVGDGRSPSASDLRYILIGDTSCSTLDIIQESLSYYSPDNIYCHSFLYQEAGEYNLTERVVYGDATFALRSTKTSFFTGATYNIRVAANFQPSDVQSGGTFGHILTFTGTGFSTDPLNLTSFKCRVGTATCQVIANPQGSIRVQLPPYQPGYETLGKLASDAADTAAQENGYLGSYGFRYTRYTYSFYKSLDLSIFDFRSGNTSETVIYDGAQTELGFPGGQQKYNDYLRGYFFAPVDGSYTFEGSADDTFVVWLSSVQSSSNPANMAVLIRSDNYMWEGDDPYGYVSTANVATRTLKKGYYYMEVIGRDYGGGNYYYVSVSLPPVDISTIATKPLSSSPPVANPTWKIENIFIAPTNPQPEIITITVDATKFAPADTYILYYFVDSNGDFKQVSTGGIKPTATAAQLKSALGSLSEFSSYGLTVTLEMQDASGAAVSTSASAVKYVYTLTYQWSRPSTYNKLPASTPTNGITVVTTQPHSPPLAGTYSFMVNGAALSVYDTALGKYSTTVQASNDIGYLREALKKYYNAPEILIYNRNVQQLPDQRDFDILYFGVVDPLPITIDTTALTGGADNVFTLTITSKRDFAANRPYFASIPYELLRMASPSPSVYLEYNSIPAICVDCTYQYQSASPVSVSAAAFKTGQAGLDITLASADATILSSIAVSDISVTLYGTPCVMDGSSTTSHLLCTFNTITCGGPTVPQLPAGNEAPQIHIRQYGFIESTIKLDNEMTISSVTPTTLGANGGVTVTVTGTGFPLSNAYPQLQITADNTAITGSITISSISNCQIQFSFPSIVPPVSSHAQSLNAVSSAIMKSVSQSTTLSYTFSYASSSYTFDDTVNTFALSSDLDPSVTGLSVQSASPILKQNIVVTGTNFDLNAANMRVFLYFASNLTKKYELGILSVSDANTMTVVLGGGRTGDYYLRVLVVGKGMSAPDDANKLSYEIVVNSLSASTGSIGGGYTLTISGSNFATAQGSTQVFIGDAINSLCLITKISATSIDCTVPTMHSDYKAGDAKTVVVTGRLIEDSRCKGTCTFAYEDTDTIYVSLSGSSSSFKAGDSVTVTTNTTFDTANTKVTVGKTPVVLDTITATSLTFTYPALSAGTYPITVTVTATGVNAYPLLQSKTELSINSISSTSGSNKGQIVSVTGNGFSSINDPSNVIDYICSDAIITLPIISITPKNLTFEVPSNPSSSCKINITMGLTYQLYNYAQSSASTPSIVVTDQGSLTYQIVATKTSSRSLKFIVARYLDADGGITSSMYPMSWTSPSTGTYIATPAGGYLPAGTFIIDASFDGLGFADSASNQFNVAPTAISTLTLTPVTVSFGGQGTVTLSASGFLTDHIENNDVTVCGIKAPILSADQTGLTFQIPPFVNAATNTKYGLGSDGVLTSQGKPISDTVVKVNYAFDNRTKTFYSSNNVFCYVGLDFGSGVQAQISQIRFMPNPTWIRMDHYFDGAVLEGSNDNATWTQIYAVDSQPVHTGWNVWIDTSGGQVLYQYVRFSQNNGTSKCMLAELEVSGIIFSTTTYSSTLGCTVAVNYLAPSATVTFPNAITYSDAATSTITSISPSFGSSMGNTVVTITGTNFAPSASSISIIIDDIPCVVTSATATQIQCTTGKRVSPPPEGNSFIATSAGNAIILDCLPFLYMDRWSSTDTWGGEVPPRDGDTVYVPPGMTLLVDQSTPFVNAIIVEGGRIIFSDETDMTLDANYFIMIGGEFRAGLPSAPYQHKLTITLHGGYYDKQLPYFGNKVLGCLNCIFNMHGIVRTPTWTQITATVAPGSNQLTLLDAVDWKVGESIAIAATSYNHFESEQRTITAVSSDMKTLTVDLPFTYRHFSGTENHGGKDFVMNAEVGLLTRNIVIQGDSMTDTYNHGSHLIFMGNVAKGLDATLSYTEIRHCGQPKIIARYCSHFHLAGEVPNSYVRGIAVHHSHARVLTIHGTHYLTVEKNVGYLVQGHNIFVEDGIETHNIIQNNLMISTIASQTMLQSDTSPASYWITNPLNTVINNHAAGGDFYGFWYEIKPNPDGPSATPNICPTGMRLGQSSNNVAHSNRRFGLRIFNYAARQYPCLPTFDESLINPFDANPAFESVFDNYLLWKNAENGLLGEQLGYVTISNFLIIDSGAAGMEFFATNLTLQNVTAEKSIIVGFSQGNKPSDMSELDNARGIITPRTDGFRADDITFVNFGTNMTPLQSCSKCESILFQVTGGKTSFFNNIKYVNILGNYIFWNRWRREIFIGEDGTLTKPITTALSLPQGSHGTITPYFDHLNISGHCYNIVPLWDNSSYCDSTITIRSLLYTNADPSDDFVGQTARTFRLNALSDPDLPATYDLEPMIIIKKSHDIPGSWAFPYAVGYPYHTHFQYGIDFLHLSLAPSQYWLPNEAIIVKFNYTDQRELYNISHYYAQAKQMPYITPTNGTIIDPTTCSNGDYTHDQGNRHLYVCISGRNKTLREWVDITGVRCLNFCPKSSPFGNREPFSRVWSNATQWPNGTLPKAGENVTIPYEWNLVLDMSPPPFYYVLINGAFYFDNQDLTFQANTIWVQQGNVYIGTAAKPFTKKATIILNGNKDDLFTVLDQDASGNKMLAVTGSLEFYGSPPAVIWTRLTAIVPANTSTITVQNLTDWKVGDEIVIGSTYSGQLEDETFKIAAINTATNTITLNSTTVYEHYGSAAPLTNSMGGVIDTRAAVGLLTRNIKITRGPDPNNWGCRVQIYSYIMMFANSTTGPKPVNGYAVFDGVELDGCGQYGSSNAAIRIEKLGSYANNTTPTIITRSTIRNCNGYCGYIDKASNVSFNNNIFHFGKRYLMYVLQVKNYIFTNNVLLGLRIASDVNLGGGLSPNNAAYEQFVSVNSDKDNVTVTNNLVQGSQDNGFVFPFTPCSKIAAYPFTGNTAGSCFAAFITNVYEGEECIAAKGFTGYASYIGFIANPPGVVTQVQYYDMFFTDNQRAFTLRFAHEIDDDTMILSNSYFMGYSRPNCPACYSPSKLSYCNDGYAIRMLTTTLSGEVFPFKKNITGFDVICTQEAFDAKAFLTNVTFENYKFGNNSAVPYCTHMNVFRKHDLASDATGVHNLYNSSCINCDQSALVYFSPSNQAWRGWSGGCGQLDCTGAINYFIHDHTGHFTAGFNNNTLQPTQLLANNQPIGGNETACQRVNDWNGYWCKFQELAVLEYQSIAADFNKRMVWPLYLAYDGGHWNSTTNAWREWSWIAPGDPAERRLARFWSVVRLSQYYNMTYSSQPPSDSVYQIQKRELPTGNPKDWVIVRIYFPIPNVVVVRVTNTTGENIMVPGYQQINGTYQDLRAVTDICGANYYQFEKNVIHFVVNGKNNCQVRLTLSSYVQLTLRFTIEMAAFYANNGPTSVLTNIIAFLNIDPSQIKIVGINPGSTILKLNILPASINDPVNTTTNSSDPTTSYLVNEPRDSVQESNELNTLNNKLLAGIKSNLLNFNYSVLNVSTTMKIISTASTPITVCPLTYLYNETSNLCYCEAGYIEINNTCIACITLGNATNFTDPNNTRRCLCKPTFVWNDSQKRCLCLGTQVIVDGNNQCFNCTGIVNGTGAADPAANSCKCNPSFAFIKFNNTCMCPDPKSYIVNKICYGCTGFGNGTGLVANTSKNCECLPTFYYDTKTSKCLCTNNYFVSKNNTCVQCPNSNCKCPTGQVFKAATLSCGCPFDVSAYVSNTCISCNSSNMTGVLNGSTQCACLPSFSWVNNACVCKEKQSIVLNNTCFICSGTNNNYSGKGVVSGNQCSCKDQFTWVAQTANCICGANSMYLDGKCYLCSQFANTVVATGSAIASCLCANNLLFDTKKFICYCSSTTAIIRQQTCVECTSTIINGISKVNVTTCKCSDKLNLIWNAATQTCICKTGYIASGTTCIKCSGLKYSTSSSLNGVSCVCQNTFVWSASTLSCICNSNSVLGPVSTTQSCINCDKFIGSTGISEVDSTQCQCIGALQWDSLKKMCVCSVSSNSTAKNSTVVYSIITPNGNCLVCNNITDPRIVNPPVDAYNCKCADPYFWDNLQMKCVSCTTLANSVSKGKTASDLICTCKTGFYFDVFTNKCIQTPKTACVAANISNCLNCAAIPYTDPSSPPVALSASTSAAAKDTSLIAKQYASLSATIGKYKTYQCLCSGGYTWEPTRLRCESVFE